MLVQPLRLELNGGRTFRSWSSMSAALRPPSGSTSWNRIPGHPRFADAVASSSEQMVQGLQVVFRHAN
jgi:hypothetical protein